MIAIHRWFRTFYTITHNDAGIAINVTLHTISGTIDVEAGVVGVGSKQRVGSIEQSLRFACQHICLQIDLHVASHGSCLVAATIYAATLVSSICHFRHELVLDGQHDEWLC